MREQEFFSGHWQRLAQELGLDEATSGKVETYLLTQYSAPQRHYHNLRHILSMLNSAEALREQFEDPVPAMLAIVFHDAVYDPARNDNEAQSAAVMRALLKGAVKEETLEVAAFTILATKAHQATEHRDTDLVIDLDMAILAQPWAIYARYAAGVMAEYTPTYGEAVYRDARPRLFLDPTVEHGQIFLTELFKPLTAQAIHNMQREREILVSGKSFSGPSRA